jgi:hypothetical protein
MSTKLFQEAVSTDLFHSNNYTNGCGTSFFDVILMIRMFFDNDDLSMAEKQL